MMHWGSTIAVLGVIGVIGSREKGKMSIIKAPIAIKKTDRQKTTQ